MNEPLFQKLVNKWQAVKFYHDEVNLPAADMELDEMKKIIQSIQLQHRIFQLRMKNTENHPDIETKNFLKEVF